MWLQGDEGQIRKTLRVYIPFIRLDADFCIEELACATFKDKVAALRASGGLGTKTLDELAFGIGEKRVSQSVLCLPFGQSRRSIIGECVDSVSELGEVLRRITEVTSLLVATSFKEKVSILNEYEWIGTHECLLWGQ